MQPGVVGELLLGESAADAELTKVQAKGHQVGSDCAPRPVATPERYESLAAFDC